MMIMNPKAHRQNMDLLCCYNLKYNIIILAILFSICLVSGTAAGANGGPDCIECHDIANTTTPFNVSVSSMNQSDNIHASLNSIMNTNAATNTSSANNSICWGCHVSGGSEPPAGYDCSNTIPYNCYECHNGTVAYTNVSSAKVVEEHFKYGEDIKARTDTENETESCIVCHNQIEMKRTYTESDNNNTNLSLASHYGKKRYDLVAIYETSADSYCMYCHNTAIAINSTNFSVTNDSITNHVDFMCKNSYCHNSGRIHDKSLEKFKTATDACSEDCHNFETTHKSSNVTCLHCHSNKTLDYQGTKLFQGLYNAKTTIHTTNKTPNNNGNTSSPLCTQCHTKTAAEIQEGYENASGGYAMMDDSSNLAPYGSNMTHKKDTVVDTEVGEDLPTHLVTYARHSNPNALGRWAESPIEERPGNQICINCHTSTIQKIQNETIQGIACAICHGIWNLDQYRLADLGQPNAHNLYNPRCSDCHGQYVSNSKHVGITLKDPKDYSNVTYYKFGTGTRDFGNTNYIGWMMNNSVHRNMTWTGDNPTKQDGCLVCHTNVGFTIDYTADNKLNINIIDRFGVHTWNSNPDCTKCHANTIAANSRWASGKSKEHGSTINNTDCLNGCHAGEERPFTSTIPLALPDRGHGHDVKPAGGPDCIGCHDISQYSPKINFNIVNNSLSVHHNIQNYTTIDSVDDVNDTNKICWACHMDNSQYIDTANKEAHADRLGDFNNVLVYTCDECHVDNITGIMPDRVLVKEHFYDGAKLKAGNSTDALTSCEVCHNLTEMKLDVTLDNSLGGTDPEDQSDASYLIAHYGKKRGTGADNIRTWDGGVNCSYCHQDSNSAFAIPSIMANPALNSSIPNHSARYPSSPANNCTNASCHGGGWMHNESLTKPVGLTTNYSDGVSSSQVCLNCHGPDNYATYTYTTGSKQRHSDTLNCTECHLYEARDIHGVKYLQKDDTYNTSNSTAVDCVRCHNDEADLDNISMFRPLVPTNSNLNFAHSEDPENGSRWNATPYWGSVEGACDYCHGDTKHNDSALGHIENIRDNQDLNTSIDSSDRWCVGCHLQSADNYNVTALNSIPPTIVINNTGNSTAYDDPSIDWFNHSISSYDDMICAACHGSLLSDNPTTKELAHNAAIGKFGPDCIDCHDTSQMSPKINFSVVNNSNAIHSNISNYPNSTINNPYSNVSDDNKICWACHMTNARTPGLDDHADRWIFNGINPYTCDECHVENIVYNLSSLVPVVKEHFFSGTKLIVNQSITSNVSSCLACHNKNEMRLETEFDGDNSNLSLVSHYGKNRSDIRTWTVDSTGSNIINCSYCHSNESSVFKSYMRNTNNSDIDEHSRYNDSTPNCTNSTCHGGNRMHDASLAKPTLMEGGAEDSAICLSCHDLTNYSTYMSNTTSKARHNGTLNCSECHLSEARDIHGVKYLQKNGTYSTSNTNAVDCYTCHSSGAVDSNISINVKIPKVPDDKYGFSHSDAPTNGRRWNETPYWNNSNEACEFCHNDTKHETIAIGPIINIDVNDSHVTITSGSTSELCSGCHVKDKISYNATLRPQAPPTICVNNTGNSTAWDGTGQGWYNHSSINKSNDAGCKGCHGSLLSNTPTTTEFVHNVGEGGGKYCVECHDIINTSMTARLQIDVQAMNKSDAIHYDLNRAAIAEMNKSHSPDNVRCWACHGQGDGSDADQPEGHPDRVLNLNPRNCSDMDCHNVNQSLFYEPMVYEHFMHVDIIDENVSTKVDCTACHINSVMPNQDPNLDNSTNTSLVSHYGSTDDLVNTTSCIYCHLDEDNAEEWGNAPDPTTNISRLSDEELEETLFIGDKWHLGNRYFLVFNDIAVDGDSAYLWLYHNDTLLEEIVVSDVYNYTYEDDFIDSDGDKVSDVVVLELNFTAIFRGEQTALVMVEGISWKRIHPEDKDPACWACHMDNHTIDKKEYLVLDEDEDYIYYLEKLLDFSDEDTEDKVTLTPRKLVLSEGHNQTLDVDGNYKLNASEVDINGNKAYITLVKDGIVIEDSVYTEGEIIEFEYDLSYDNHKINDFVIFTAKVDSIFHGYDTDLVSLTDVKVFSDRLMAAEIDDDEKVGGYNTTQLHVNDTFSIGGYPDTFHVPPLNEGLDGGSDCVRCHDVSHRFGISSVDAIQSRLGGHSQLNANATSKDNTIDDINKACWACHGTGVDPERHPADYLYPRQCQDCHTDMEAPTYGAVDISDENHGQFEDCNRCHAADYPGLHVINVFEPDIPYIVSINMSSEVVTSGETVTVKAAAMSSWNMKVKAIEYFIDVEGLPGTGTQLMPLDGTFDEQVEEVEFTIDTTELVPGVHTIYLRAMERDNEWGPVNEAEFSIHIPVPGAEPESKLSPLLIAAIIIGIAGILLLLLRKSGYLFNLNEVPGIDTEKLLELLEQNYGIDWAKTANIEKIDDGKVVRVFTDVNDLTLELNDEKTRLYLNINGGKTDEFIVKMKDGEPEIFKKGIRYKKGMI